MYALWRLPLILFVTVTAYAGDQDPAAILELGAQPSWSVNGEFSLGPTVAVEFTPIENWLELEAGFTPSFRRGATEWSTDLLFKKPWTLSKKAELMVGVGPEWIRSGGTNFMYWPTAARRFGWYVEPAYDYRLRTWT